MATQVTDPDSRQVTERIRVSVPDKGLAGPAAVGTVWCREPIRFRSDRLHALTWLVQPGLFLFMLGAGLSMLSGHGLPPGIDF